MQSNSVDSLITTDASNVYTAVRWMAVEQIRNETPATKEADVWSFGMVLNVSSLVFYLHLVLLRCWHRK